MHVFVKKNVGLCKSSIYMLIKSFKAAYRVGNDKGVHLYNKTAVLRNIIKNKH